MTEPATQLDPAQEPVPIRPQKLQQLHRLGRSFWLLYASSCLVDLGLCLYFFMYSLFLVEHSFAVRSIGFIASALTIGTIAGVVVVSFASRRLGLRAMMLTFIFAAPVCFALRLFFLQMPAQLGLALLAGFVMSIWSVCFSPTLAKLTTQKNRTFGFSLFVATGIGSGALAGVLGGHLPGLFVLHHWGGAQADGIRTVLLLACCILMLAGFAVFQLRVERDEAISGRARIFSGFLVRFLLVIAVWNFAISFFVPFANVYLSRQLGLSVLRIGQIFTISQLVQVAMVLAAPILYRWVGIVTGIALTQMGAAGLFFALSRAPRTSTAVCVFVCLNAVQWMGGPGICSLLMNRTVEIHRSQASAIYNIVNLGTQAAAATVAGFMFERYGYSGPLAADASLAALACILLYTLLGDVRGNHEAADAV